MKNVWFLIALLAALCCVPLVGCNIKGLTSGYKKLSHQQKNSIHSTQDLTADAVQNGQLYNLSATKLRQWIKNEPHSLVYLWVPHCSGKRCYPLPLFQSYAAEKKLKLYIVADAYEMEDINKQLSSACPIYIIDANAYHSNLRNTYRKAFVKQLAGGGSLPDSALYASNLFFSHDTLQKATFDLYR